MALNASTKKTRYRPGPTQSGTGVFAVVMLLNVLLGIGLLMQQEKSGGWTPAMRWVKNTFSATETSESGNDEPMGPVIRLPDTLVRLQGSADRYVQARFDLEVAMDEDKLAVSSKMPRIHEATMDFLSTLKPEQLRGSHELENTKLLLLTRLRHEVPEQSLKAVYVSRLVFGGV